MPILAAVAVIKKFGTGVFGKQNYGSFDRDKWTYRSMDKHRKDFQLTLGSSTKTERIHIESLHGCRYFCLLQLPYFDPIKMLVIDPMHNLYLGICSKLFGQKQT